MYGERAEMAEPLQIIPSISEETYFKDDMIHRVSYRI